MAFTNSDLFLVQRSETDVEGNTNEFKLNANWLQLKDSVNSDAVLLSGNQDILGVKQFNDNTVFTGGIDTSYVQFTASTNPNGNLVSAQQDQYQYGTWLAQPSGDDTFGVWDVTEQMGSYVRIGNMVTVEFEVSWNSQVGATGKFMIGNIPFPIKNGTVSTGAVLIQGFNPAPGYFGPVLKGNAIKEAFVVMMSPLDDADTWRQMNVNPDGLTPGRCAGQITYITEA